jgi:hypothetical protein
MWMTYKNHQIKACSQYLGSDRWLPMALAWLSAGSPELLQHIYGELSETCNTEYEANAFALEKAKNWIDQQSIGEIGPIRLQIKEVLAAIPCNSPTPDL